MDRTRVMRVIARMNVGGPAVQISGLMRSLDEDRFDQRLFTGWCAEDEADFLVSHAPDVAATRVPALGRAVRPWDDANAIRQLVAHIREFDPHVIHTHTAKAGVVGRVSARLAKSQAKVVHTYHGHLLHGYFGSTKTRAVVEVERRLARGSDVLVAVGNRVRDDLLQAGIGRPEQYAVIPPGLALGALPLRSTARESLGLPAEAYVVGFVGRLTSIKRPDRMLDVARALKESSPHALIVVAGAGDVEAEVHATVLREDLPIRMLGWRSDVEQIFAACDSVLLTSDNEGTPLSLIQAGLAGLPVVSTDVGSVREIVVDGRTGLLTETNPAALARNLESLAGDPKKSAEMGRSAQEWTQANYGVDRLVRDHERMYEELLG